MPLAEACAIKGLNVDDVIASLEAATTPSAAGEKDWSENNIFPAPSLWKLPLLSRKDLDTCGFVGQVICAPQ